jgi:hypothetical protein
MTKTTKIVAGVALALILLIALGTMLYHPVQPKPKVATPIAMPPSKVCSPAESRGSLARGEAGMKTDVWYFKYEDPTCIGPLEISFAPGAQCQVDGVVAKCNAMNPSSGAGASFVGAKDGDLFRVSSLSFTTKK